MVGRAAWTSSIDARRDRRDIVTTLRLSTGRAV
jgi:hypothetical protein